MLGYVHAAEKDAKMSVLARYLKDFQEDNARDFDNPNPETLIGPRDEIEI